MVSPDTESWFAVQVASQHEKKVALMLEYKGYRQFLPTYKSRRKWSDRVKTIEQPLFPGYVFCRSRRSQIGLALGTLGIYGIVSFGGRPYAVLDEEIAALQQVVHSRREVSSCGYIPAGRRVRVNEGPLSGVTGIITRIKNHDRLIISVNLITKSISVDVHADEVIPLDGDPAGLSA